VLAIPGKWTDPIEDPRLYGDLFIAPFRFSARILKNSYSSLPPGSSQVVEVFKRALIFIPSAVVTTIAAPVAVLGIVVKWIDLSVRIDQFAYRGAAIAPFLPLPLEVYSRLGDRVATYLHAKCVGEQFQIPVYFRPFQGSEFFAFSQEEHLKHDTKRPLYFKRIITLNSAEDLKALKGSDVNDSVLYLLPFCPHEKMKTHYSMDWQAFKPRIKELLNVVQPHQKLDIPKNAYSIALHVRTGGDYDRADTSTMQPKKLPPFSYYVGELERFLNSRHLPKCKPLFIHIFTDDLQPVDVYQRLKEALEKKGVFPRVGGRDVTLSYSASPRLIDDVANMTRFHCLIRPDSYLSGTLVEAADRLHIQIVPEHFRANDAFTEIAIDQTKSMNASGDVEIRETNYTMPTVQQLPQFFYRWFHRNFS
jgi:hypothetical protein